MKHLKLKSVVLSAVMLMSTFAFLPKQANAAVNYKLTGTAHVQDYGDVAGKWNASTGILTLGTRGQSKRVEAITVNLENNTGVTGSLKYRVHVQNEGWQGWKTSGQKAGTSGKSYRLEGLQIELTGDLAEEYIVEYRVHIQDYGDNQGWVHDGALAGTTGESKRLEEVQIRLVKYEIGEGEKMSINYRVHVQDKGWESEWSKDGEVAGTVGSGKRLEAIEIHLSGTECKGDVNYQTHIQNIGWETGHKYMSVDDGHKSNGEMSGTQGKSLRLEGIEIELYGAVWGRYDLYYRVHVQDYGWLQWASYYDLKNSIAGTAGMSKRLEAIQIVLVKSDHVELDGDISYFGSRKFGDLNGITSVNNTSFIDKTDTEKKYDSKGNIISDESAGTYWDGSEEVYSLYTEYFDLNDSHYLIRKYHDDDGNITLCLMAEEYSHIDKEADTNININSQVFKDFKAKYPPQGFED